MNGYRVTSILLLILIVVGGTNAQDIEPIGEIPKNIRSFLKTADNLEIRMQTAERDGKLVAAMRKESEYKPNVTKVVTDSDTRKTLLKSFFEASKTDERGSACYLPSHTIFAQTEDEFVDIEICFGCRRFTIRGSFGEYYGTLKYENKAEAAFNNYLLEN